LRSSERRRAELRHRRGAGQPAPLFPVMTTLTRPLQRSTTGRYAVLYVGDRRPIIVSLLPGDVIAFREYRRRQVFSLPIDYAFKCAVTSAARAAKSKPKR